MRVVRIAETEALLGLTKREFEVVEQLVAGRANKEIANALELSTKTVEFHVKNILRKAGVSSRLEFVCRMLA
jgi:DNA-binding NarL/FixJ family response regulator